MIGRSMLAYIPVNLANILTSFGTIAILTRLLDGTEFGRYALAMITLQFFHMGVFTWLEAAIARYQARAEADKDEADHLKSLYAYTLRLALPALAVGLAVIWVLDLSQPMKIVVSAAVTSTCFQVFLNLGMEAHKASHRIGRYSAVHTTQMLLSFSLGIFAAIHLREVGPFLGIVIANLIVLAIDLPFMWRRMKTGHVQPERMRKYFKYGMPICVSLLLTYALNSADMFLIARFLETADAGAYNAGYNLANRSLDVLFIWMGMAVTPMVVSALEREGVESSTDILRDYGATLLWLAMPAATGIALVSQQAGFILGEPVRAQAVEVMPLIAFAGVLNGMISYYAHRAFMLSGKTDQFIWCMVPPVVLNVGLNLWLIPQYGLQGAVIATVASYALGLVIALTVGRRLYPLPIPFKALLQVSVACAVMALGVMMLPIPQIWPDPVALIAKAAVGMVVYAGMSWGLNIANCRSVVAAILAKFFKQNGATEVETVS